MENNNRQGCRWVKASEGLPENEGLYNCKVYGIPTLLNRYEMAYATNSHAKNIEWLSESIEPCATSSDAIKFAEWIRINAVSGNDGTWHYQESKNMYKCVNETELYQIYSQTPSPTGDRDCEELKAITVKLRADLFTMCERLGFDANKLDSFNEAKQLLK